MSKIVASHGRVVLCPADEDEKTAGGLVLPGASRSDYGRFKVVAVGEGVTLPHGATYTPVCKPGDTVLASKSMGSPFMYGGQPYILMDYINVGAVLG